MAQLTIVGTDTTLATPASGKKFAMYPSKEHCDYDDLESAILSAISVSNIPSAIPATKIADGSVDNTEFQYLNGVTSAIQTQLNTKLSDITGESIGDLSDVTITAIASGELLKWNGSAWVNNTLAEAGISAVGHTHTASEITDLATASVTFSNKSGNISQWTNDSAYLTSISGLAPDTATTAAAQPNITSLGTLTALQVDNININGNTISSTDANGNVVIDPNGTGNVQIGNFVFDADQTVGVGQDNYVLTYDNAAGTIGLEAATGGAGVSDGDKGDITVSGSGTTWTIDDEAVTFAKMQHVATSSILGRATAATGDIEALTATQVRTIINVEDGADVTDTTNVTAAGALMDSEVSSLSGIKTLTVPDNTTISTFGATLVDDIDAATARTTLGVDAAGTDNSTPVTLAGTPDYLTLSGQQITLGQIDLATDVTGDLPFSNIAQIATNRILGRSTAGTGDIEALADSAARTIMGLAATDSPQFTGIELGHATDTTISRVSAGVIAVEGVTVPTISSTDTFTNKAIALGSNTVSGTQAQFDTACTDGNFVYTDDIGVSVQAYDADTAKLDTAQTWTALQTFNQVAIDPTPTADETCNGPSTTVTAGATITAFTCVMLQADGKFDPADSSTASSAGANGMLGLALEASTDTNDLDIALPGSFVRDDTWNWTVGGIIYLGTSGALTQTAPSTTGHTQRILGYAYTADIVFWNPENTFIELA